MTAAETKRIGWIGVGKMGTPMATNVMNAGYPLTVYSRSADSAQSWVKRGAAFASTISSLAKECDIVFSTISDDLALQSVTIEPGGLFQNAAAGLIYVDMSTVSPSMSERVAQAAKEKGIQYLRAPVSGSTTVAAAGALTILASGSKETYERCLPVFHILGKKLYYLGGTEQARYLKIAINMMVGLTSAMLGEALALAERGGVDWTQMIDVINNSVVASPLVGYKANMLATRNFSPMFTSLQMAKDFDLALEAGRNGNVTMPLTAVARQFFGAVIASGRGELDFFAYVTLLEELAGLRGSSADN